MYVASITFSSAWDRIETDDKIPSDMVYLTKYRHCLRSVPFCTNDLKRKGRENDYTDYG